MGIRKRKQMASSPIANPSPSNFPEFMVPSTGRENLLLLCPLTDQRYFVVFVSSSIALIDTISITYKNDSLRKILTKVP